MSFALGFVVDQIPVAAVGLIAGDIFEEHGSQQKFETQEGRALVGEPFRDLGPFIRLGDGHSGAIAGHSDERRLRPLVRTPSLP